MEAAQTPLIVVLHQPRAAGYLAYDGAFHRIDDGDVRTLNRGLDDAVAAFDDGRVVAADADDELHSDTVIFLKDRLHPNEVGHKWLAKVVIDAFEGMARRVGEVP